MWTPKPYSKLWLYFSNDYCDELPDYNTKEVQELLTYGWNESQKFKDIRSRITLSFVKNADLCYLASKKDYKGQRCVKEIDVGCTGIDGFASGMDYLALLIVYSNYQNTVYHISNIVWNIFFCKMVLWIWILQISQLKVFSQNK